MIDTHCHLLKEYYEDLDIIIKEAEKEGITKMIASGDSKKDNLEVLEIISKYDSVYGVIGYHPEFADDITDEDLELLKKQIVDNKKIVGLGEVGLDYHYRSDNKDKQHDIFRKQLDIATELNIPVVIHSRDATEDVIKILSEYNLKCDIHCFSGSLETAKIYIKKGYMLGIGGVSTFKNSKLKEHLKEIPIENIILETDSPYLAPDPFRGKQNSPKYIKTIAQNLANIKEKDIKEIAKITTENACKLFDLNR